jgi:hypothetical protein
MKELKSGMRWARYVASAEEKYIKNVAWKYEGKGSSAGPRYRRLCQDNISIDL